MPSTHLSLHYHIVSQRTATDGSSPNHGARNCTPTANQHHRNQTMEEEYEDLLRLSDVEFDEKYLS